MQYGSAGAGSPTHLACALLNAAIGVDVTHIPYRAGGELGLQDLIAGRIDYMCPTGRLAIRADRGQPGKGDRDLGEDRSPVLPNLASAHEQGLTDFETAIWFAFFLPKGTPTAIVQKLNDAAVATMKRRPCSSG